MALALAVKKRFGLDGLRRVACACCVIKPQPEPITPITPVLPQPDPKPEATCPEGTCKCSFDYSTIEGWQVRARQALTECKSAGINRDKAVSLIALSRTECQVELLKRKESGKLDCECRVPLAIEVNWETKAFYDHTQASSSALDYLKANGWLSQNQHGYCPGGELALGMNNSAIAAYFEWVLQSGDDDLLESFSIGMTCMHLRKWNREHYCGWPWPKDKLEKFYLSCSVPEQLNQITYLDPVCGAHPYAGSLPIYRDKGVLWLSRHTGDTGLAGKLWDGTLEWISYPHAYRDTVAAVNTMAEEMNYVADVG
jgi:hypothetical protein